MTDRELDAEQRHLDRTWSAYERVLRALSGERGAGIDEFANEALERMRRERLRLYTSSSGPLYFGRIDAVGGERRYIGRHAIADEDNELLVVNWRAPAAEPFYAATTADHRGLLGRRRLDVEDRRVLGFVDETLSEADGSRVLDDAIVQDITRRRVGEMRQIVSTITPDQYELIARDVDGALVIQGGPGPARRRSGCTAPRGCCTPIRRWHGRASWSWGPTSSSSPTSRRCCPRWARRRSSSARSTRWPPRAATGPPSR